jgi:alkylated DNA nucleotide flippase Atl1
MYSRRSWREKMNNPNLPKLVPIPPRMRKRLGTGTMLLPSPRDVEALIRAVRKGSLTTVPRIREALAGKEARAGKTRITPYWRVVKDDGSLNPKFPGGVEQQAERLRAEGHRIVAGRGKRPPRVAQPTPQCGS